MYVCYNKLTTRCLEHLFNMGLQTERLITCAGLFRRAFYRVTETYISRILFSSQSKHDAPETAWIVRSRLLLRRVTRANPRGCPADHHVPREGTLRTTTCHERVPCVPPRATRGCPADHHVPREGNLRTTTCHERVPGGPPRATRGCPVDHHVPREGARRTTTCHERVPGGPPRATRGCPADHHVPREGVRRTTTCHERVPGGPPRATRGYLADHHVPREGTLRTTRATRPKRVSWRTLETGVTHQPMVYTRTLQ